MCKLCLTLYHLKVPSSRWVRGFNLYGCADDTAVVIP